MQFSLRFLLAAVFLFALELWLVRQGIAFSIFMPLVLAMVLELGGYRRAAKYAAVGTIAFWLIGFCVIGLLASRG